MRKSKYDDNKKQNMQKKKKKKAANQSRIKQVRLFEVEEVRLTAD